MPSPFNDKKAGPVENSTGPAGYREVFGTLFCEHCFFDSKEGWYSDDKRVLKWLCERCKVENIVRNIEIE